MEDLDQKYRTYFTFNLFLIAFFGLIMVFSSSYIHSKEVYGSSIYLVGKQLGFFLFGLLLFWVISKSKFSFWQKIGPYFNFASCFLLLLTIIPGLGVQVKGATRWLNLKVFAFQPGEMVKVSIIFAAYHFFQKFNVLSRREKFIFGSGLAAPLLLFLSQPDFGSFSICLAVIGFVCFLSEFSRKWFYGLCACGLTSIIALIFVAPYRVQRLLVFLDPWKDPRNAGFQIIQSFLAFANGSFWGKGIGESTEKLFYLPEAHNDFIFSVVGEEFGFIGVLFSVAAYLSLIFWGFKLSLARSKSPAGLIIAAIIFLIGSQTFLNMAVVLGLLPTKGLNLPFLSYGGSSLVSNFFAIGLLMSAYESTSSEDIEASTRDFSQFANQAPSKPITNSFEQRRSSFGQPSTRTVGSLGSRFGGNAQTPVSVQEESKFSDRFRSFSRERALGSNSAAASRNPSLSRPVGSRLPK